MNVRVVLGRLQCETQIFLDDTEITPAVHSFRIEARPTLEVPVIQLLLMPDKIHLEGDAAVMVERLVHTQSPEIEPALELNPNGHHPTD